MNNTTKALLLTAAIGTTVIMGIVLLSKYGIKRVTKKSFKKFFTGTGLYTVPDTSFSKCDVVVVYGGLHYATADWMFNEVATHTPNLLYSNVFVFLPYSASLSQQEALIQAATAGKKINSYSLIGFSKGGEAVVTLKNFRRWRFVGLIDPAIGWNYSKRSWGKESVLTYGSKPMMDIYEKNGMRYSDLSSIIKKGKGIAEKTVTNHKDAPKEFFTKFEKKINHGA